MGTTVSVLEDKIYINFGDKKVNTETAEKIFRICMKKKKLYLSGYEHSHDTRVKMAGLGIIFKKWEDCPEMCITFTFHKDEDRVIIGAQVAQNGKTKRRPLDEQNYFLMQWQQDVADEIEQVLG